MEINMLEIFKVRGKGNYKALLLSVFLAEGLGFLSGFLSTADPVTGYGKLDKPPLLPPGWVFPVVWTILYFLMAVAAYRVWLSGKQGARVSKPLGLYIVQLVLNFLWPIIFFRFSLYGWALVELLLMLVSIVLTTAEFYKADTASGNLMLPYVIWVSFAVFLNYGFWILN